jgi:hypothetical protein
VRHLPTDFEQAHRLRMVAGAWYLANWRELPWVFGWRLKNYVENRGASGLTKVSREELFTSPSGNLNSPFSRTSWLNLLLLDKTPTVCFLALGGLMIFAWKFRTPGLVLVGVALVPWLVGATIIGYERVVESSIGLTIWLALFGLAHAVSWLDGYEAARRPREAP